MNNDFFKSLEYEKSMYQSSNTLYEKWIKHKVYANFPVNQIEIDMHRWDFNTPEGKAKQMSDIDITIDVDVKSGQIKNHRNISEKFRKDDYGDIFIELYSKYPNVKGWGPNTEADLIFYHTPNTLYTIDAKDIKRISNDIINKFDINNLYNKMIDFGTNQLIQEYNGFSITFIKVPTYINGKRLWGGVGVCIQWSDLKKLNIVYNKIDKNFVNSL